MKSTNNQVYPEDEEKIDLEAQDQSLSCKAIVCCLCCTIFIVIAFIALTILPDELSKRGVDINEEIQSAGIDFFGSDTSYNKTINKTLRHPNTTSNRNVTEIIEKIKEQEQVTDPDICQELHPNNDNIFGEICMMCTSKTCNKWQMKACDQGNIYDIESKKCNPCS